MDGAWSSPGLPAALAVAAINREALGVTGGWLRLPLQVPRTIAHRARRNTVAGSRRNIHAHYDLGNDFYRLFLDETLTYSSAVFASPDQSLADAQRNKYRVIAERAGLHAGMNVLEIGSGWGGFALYAAGELGCHVTSITVSKAQHELANQRIAQAGLGGSCERGDARLPRGPGPVRRNRVDRDARGRGRRVLRGILSCVRPARSFPAARSASSRSASRTWRTSLSAGRPTGFSSTSSRAVCCRPSPQSNARCTERGC